MVRVLAKDIGSPVHSIRVDTYNGVYHLCQPGTIIVSGEDKLIFSGI